MMAQMLVLLVVPSSAWAWDADGKYQVATYNAAIVKDGAITLDGVLDHSYLFGTRIVSYINYPPYIRGGYSAVADAARGNFYAYVAVDTKGMYIFCEVEDITIFPSTNSNANDGDMVNIYFDWVDTHPSPENRTSDWSASDYLKNNSGTQMLGWLSADYYGKISGSRGFGSYTKFGPNKNQSAVCKTKIVDGGWTLEWFIPWRDKAQSAAVAKGESIPLGIGFEIGDDSDIKNEVTPDKEQNVAITHDQRKELGLGYYSDYSKLAQINLIKGYGETYNTCTVKGLADVVCDHCGEVVAENVKVTVSSGTQTSHAWKKSAEHIEPSCEEAGYEFFECKYCDAVKESTLPALGHSYEYSEREGRHICTVCRGRAVHGDVNGDGDVTNSDVLEVFRYIYNPELYPVDYTCIADVNGDGDVTNSDVLEVFRYIYNPDLYPIADKLPEVMVDGRNLSDYVIIYPEADANGEKALANELAASINDKYGLDIEVYADSLDVFEYEIIVGEADRNESRAVYSETFDYSRYAVSASDKKIAVGFADNKFASAKAMEDVIEMMTVSGSVESKKVDAVAEKVLTSFMFTDVHNNFGMLEPTNNYGNYIVRKNVDRAIDHLLSTVGAVDVVLVGGDLISDYHSWNKSGKWPYKYFVEYRKILVDTFKRLSKDGKVSYVAGNHDYAQGELSTDGPGKNGSYNSFDFYFGDVGMRQDWGELPPEDMFVKIGEKTGEKYLLAYYYEVDGIGFVGLSADHDAVWSVQGSGFDQECLDWLDKKLDEVDPDGDKVIFVNCHYFADHRRSIEADGTNKYSNTSGYDKESLTPVFIGHKNLYHIFGHGEVWYSDTTVRYASHHDKKGLVIDVTGKETESTQIVSYEDRDFTSIYGGHFRPDANSYASWFEKDYVYGYAGLDEYGYTHRSTCTPKVAQGLYI